MDEDLLNDLKLSYINLYGKDKEESVHRKYGLNSDRYLIALYEGLDDNTADTYKNQIEVMIKNTGNITVYYDPEFKKIGKLIIDILVNKTFTNEFIYRDMVRYVEYMEPVLTKIYNNPNQEKLNERLIDQINFINFIAITKLVDKFPLKWLIEKFPNLIKQTEHVVNIIIGNKISLDELSEVVNLDEISRKVAYELFDLFDIGGKNKTAFSILIVSGKINIEALYNYVKQIRMNSIIPILDNIVSNQV